MSITPPRYRTLQAGRGIASVAIVLHHTFPICSGFAVGVAYFFVLSGVVILLAHLRDIGEPSTVGRYLGKRLIRVYPIYWLVLLPYVLHPSSSPVAAINRWASVGISFSLLPIPADGLILVVAWTLQHEVAFYLVFVLLLLNRRLGILFFSLWIGAGCLQFFHAVPPVWSVVFSELHLLFALGMMCALCIRYNWGLRHPRSLVAFGSIVLACAVALMMAAGGPTDHLQLVGGVGAALIILGTATLEQQGALHVPGWLNTLGAASYSIYLIHVPLSAVFGRHISFVTGHGGVQQTGWLTVMFLLSLAGGLLLYYFVEKPLLKVLQRSGYKPTVVPSSSRVVMET